MLNLRISCRTAYVLVFYPCYGILASSAIKNKSSTSATPQNNLLCVWESTRLSVCVYRSEDNWVHFLSWIWESSSGSEATW